MENLEIQNKILQEENRKLRQFLVDLQLTVHELYKKILELGGK